MLTQQRRLFSLPDDLHYLNCAARAPLLKSAEALGIEGVLWQRVPEGAIGEGYHRAGEVLRERIATLINASTDQIAITPAVSYGVAIAAHNTPLRRGQNVVLPEEEFPSDVYAWMAPCAESGAQLRLVPRPADAHRPGSEWSARIAEAIDSDTAVVNLSSVQWTDGVLRNLEEIGERAREVGALFVVDGTQSIGAHPFDFARLQPDLLVCSGYKWLLGPYQVGFAALGQRLLEGKPFENHWSNRTGKESVDAGGYHTEYREGARRFDGGEHANTILVPMLSEGVRQILEWGVENIRAYCADLGSSLQGLLEGEGFSIAPEAERAAHIIGLRLADEGRFPAVLEELRKRNVRISRRGNALRVSPHVYNSAEDMAALCDGLAAAMK